MADVIRVGDRVTDCNPTWPRYNQSGTVVSVQGENITWQSDTDGQFVTDTKNDIRREISTTTQFMGTLGQHPRIDKNGNIIE